MSMIGRVVCSKAGKDKGCFMVVVGLSENGAFVCDGGKRPIERPKLKNIKHLALTNAVFESNQFETNSSLRRNLKEFTAQDKP